MGEIEAYTKELISIGLGCIVVEVQGVVKELLGFGA